MANFVTFRKASVLMAVASLAAMASGAPVHDATSSMSTSLTPRDSTVDEFCPREPYGDLEAQKEIWDITDAGRTLNDRVNKAYSEWFQTLVGDVLEDEGDMTCGSYGSNCIAPDCPIVYKNGYGNEFWILRSVERFHHIITRFRDEILIKEALTLAFVDANKIADDFGVDNDKAKEAGKFLSTFGAAVGGLGAAVPQLSAPAGVIGAIFSALGTNIEEGEEVDHVGDLQQVVAKTLRKLGDMLESLRDDVLGYPGSDYGNLPNDSDAEHGNRVAQFFDSGRWLMHDNDAEVTAYIDRAKKYIKESLVVHMLKLRGYEVGIWDEIDGEMCVALSEKGTNPFETARHVKDLHVDGCYFLYDPHSFSAAQRDPFGPISAGHTWPATIPVDIMHKIHDHGLDIGQIYYNALMCASTKEEQSPADVIFSSYATKAPRCLFDLPIKKLSYDSSTFWVDGLGYVDGKFQTLEDSWEL